MNLQTAPDSDIGHFCLPYDPQFPAFQHIRRKSASDGQLFSAGRCFGYDEIFCLIGNTVLGNFSAKAAFEVNDVCFVVQVLMSTDP